MSHPVTPGSCAPHAKPMCIPRPRDLMARSLAAVFQDSHMPYGIRNSEFQNRESGNPESWCGRVGHLHPSWSHEVDEMLVVWILRLGVIKRLLKQFRKLLLELP